MPNAHQRQPDYQDKFWQIDYGSGRIVLINYAMRTVEVSYYDKGTRRYTFDSIVGCYENSFGGCWMIHDSDIGE